MITALAWLGVIAALLLVTYVSQKWDDRERAKAATAKQDTEATCRAQQAKQVAHITRHIDDPRTAGRPIEPKAAKRNYRHAA